jgi:hypothetical protein
MQIHPACGRIVIQKSKLHGEKMENQNNDKIQSPLADLLEHFLKLIVVTGIRAIAISYFWNQIFVGSNSIIGVSLPELSYTDAVSLQFLVQFLFPNPDKDSK